MKDPRVPPDAAAPAGAPPEEASLFSADSFKKQAATGKPKPKDDSGLIDLKALAGEQAPSPQGLGSLGDPSGIFAGASPFGTLAAPPVDVGPAARTRSARPRATKAFALPVAVISVAAVVAVLVFRISRAPSGVAAASVSASATVTPASASAAAPAPTEVGTAEAEVPNVAAVTPGQRPPPVETATATAAPTAAPVPPVAAAPRAWPASKAAAPAPAPKAPANTCDLACQMRRAVRKKR